jgi:hypothetical protein
MRLNELYRSFDDLARPLVIVLDVEAMMSCGVIDDPVVAAVGPNRYSPGSQTPAA